jgi:ssDNA-binding Zn-finger/Zn-ribbon topoisomerase 1
MHENHHVMGEKKMDSDIAYIINILFWGALLGLIPGAIAHNKGYSFATWWFFGALVFIIALPASIVLKPNTQELEKSAISTGGRKCPHCAEIIKREAKVCRFCGRDVEPLPAPPDPSDYSRIERQINPSELNQSDEYYYKQGLSFMRKDLYDNAVLEFLKAIRVSSSKGKWYSSSQARLLEIRNSGREINPLQTVASNQTNIPHSKLLKAAQHSSVRLCPKCGIPMETKVANKGEQQGKSFYVCPNYKQCQQFFPLAEK